MIIENRRVLVTGGAGFIGSNLTEVLLRQGTALTCLDNFTTGKRANIMPFLRHPAFTLIEGDIPHSHADISRARKMLYFRPAVAARAGLNEAAAWYWAHLGNPSAPAASHEPA